MYIMSLNILINCPSLLVDYHLNTSGQSHICTDMGVMVYITKSKYSYHQSLGLDKFPGGYVQVTLQILQFTINI